MEFVGVETPIPTIVVGCKCPLTTISVDATLYLIGFMPLESLLQFSSTSRGLKCVARANAVWSSMLRDHLDVEDVMRDRPPLLPALPSMPSSPTGEGEAFFSAYLSWRQEFHGYPVALVRRVKTWWRRIEAWLALNFPEIRNTLGPPLSEATIIETLTKNRAFPQFIDTVPPVLRLLYRFHDGQHIPAQDRLLHDTRSAQIETLEEFIATGYGLFGGVSFYDRFTNCYMVRFLPAVQRESSKGLVVW